MILDNCQEPDGPLSKSEQKFFQLMEDVEYPLSEESTVDDFALFLLSMLDYDHNERRLHTKKEMSFVMCGQRVNPSENVLWAFLAKADVVLMNRERYLLLVEEDKRLRSTDEPEAQFIAETIAAADMNNSRRQIYGLQPLDTQIIPGIIMVGTSLTFYRAMVTTALISALASATEPAKPTVVLKYTPPVPDAAKYVAEGMRPLENRRIVFQCLEAFKAVIN